MPAKFIPFTVASIDRLPIPTGRHPVEYPDQVNKKLYCRVYPTGRKTFSVMVWCSAAQKAVRDTIGPFPSVTPKQAQSEARKRLGDIARGDVPGDRKRRSRQQAKFGKLFEDYMLHHGDKLRSANEIRSTYRRYLERPLGGLLATEITRADLKAIHKDLTTKGTPIAANRALALVSSIYSWAIDDGQCADNPANGVRRNSEVKRERFVQPGELLHFFRAVDLEPNSIVRDFILMSLYTGQRRSNVLAMKWAEIDFHNAVWNIPMTKNGTAHTLPLDGEVLALLERRALERTGQYVFPGGGKTGHFAEPKTGWRRVIARMEALMLIERLEPLTGTSEASFGDR